jgi:hypothetical protein
MATKLSAIAAAGANVASGDFLVGVTTANVDELFSRAQVGAGILGNIAVPLATTAGTVFAASTTAATATASSTAGVGLTITADAAVAGSTNAGAAAGGNVTITSGAAARLTSGNANGGAINLTTGAGTGTGVPGNVVLNTAGTVLVATASGAGEGSFTASGIQFGSNNSQLTGSVNAGVAVWASGSLDHFIAANFRAYQSGVRIIDIGNNNAVGMGTGALVAWANSTDGAQGKDTGLSRAAAKVVAIGAGSAQDATGWFNYGGTSRVSGSDVTNATATLANITGLSATLVAGRFYFIRMVLKGINSTATDGLQFDFNGGTATATAFWMAAGILASGGTDVVGTNVSTSLAGVINFTTFTGESGIVFEGYIQCNAAGTLIPRFAENSHTAGTATVRVGSKMELIDTP